MLRLPAFAYAAPATLAEVVDLLARHGARAMLHAGGTDLLPGLKRRQFQPELVVGLGGVRELHGIHGDRHQGMTIGAMTTLNQVAAHPEILAAYPALAQAAAAVATVTIRNQATLGGNLCLDTRCNYYNQTEEWRRAIGYCLKCQGSVCRVAPSSPRCVAVSSTDTAPALAALGARVRLLGGGGPREIPVLDLYGQDGIHYLNKAPDELLTAVILPPADGWRSVYLKLRRRASFDFPILGVGAALRLDAGGRVAAARVVLGAAAPHPLPVPEAAELAGHRPDDPEAVARVAAAAYQRAKPLDNTDLTTPYRKRMAQVYTARALQQLSCPPGTAN